MNRSAALVAMGRRKSDLIWLRSGYLDLNVVCPFTGMSPLSAAAYAQWPAGVELLLSLGVNRRLRSTFGGYAAGAAVIGAYDRIRLGRCPREAAKRCADTLRVLLPVPDTCGYSGSLIRSVPEVLLMIEAEANRRKYRELKETIERIRRNP